MTPSNLNGRSELVNLPSDQRVGGPTLRFPVCQAKQHSARIQSTSLRAHEHARVHTSKLNTRTSHFALFSIVEHHCTAPCTCQLKTPLPPFSESSRHWIALLQYVNAALNMVHDLAVGHSKELRAVAGMLNRTRTSWRIYICLLYTSDAADD